MHLEYCTDIDRKELKDNQTAESQTHSTKEVCNPQQDLTCTTKNTSQYTDSSVNIIPSSQLTPASLNQLIKDSLFSDPDTTINSLCKTYGAMPGYTDLEDHMQGVQEDVKELIDTGIDIRQFELKGLLLYRLKFGESIYNLANQVLANYPTIGEKGRVISLFGLPGSGKSFALHALQDLNLSNVVIIDSDTSRMNLFAKIIKDLELANGSSLDHIRSKLIYKPLTEIFYTTLTYIAAKLRQDGYTVVQASVGVNHNSDEVYYVEHRDVNPRDITIPEDLETLDPNPDFQRTITRMLAITESRVFDIDDYDWTNATQITDFSKMTRVTVKTGTQANKIFIKEIKERLTKSPNTKTITNPEFKNKDEAKKHLIKQLSNILEV